MSQTEHTERFAVSAESQSETRTVVAARDFDFVVDEPPALDGTDAGPNPVEYLIGAWAGCLNVVAHTVAEERGFALEGLTIDVEGDLDPRTFLGVADDARAGYQEVRVDIDAETDADPEALEGFTAEIEARCPVGDNVANPTPTNVTVDLA